MVKCISLSEPAYKELKVNKMRDESFSDTVLRVLKKEKKNPLLAIYGSWKGDKKELDMIERTIAEDRKKSTMREVQF